MKRPVLCSLLNPSNTMVITRRQGREGHILIRWEPLHRRDPRVIIVLACYLFNGAHGRQSNVFAPGTSDDLHADGQARAAKLHFSRSLLYNVTRRSAPDLFTGTHAGARHYARRIAEYVVEDGVTAGGQDIAARPV